MGDSRRYKIKDLACQGNLNELTELLGIDFTQDEIALTLADALTYSHIETEKWIKYGY